MKKNPSKNNDSKKSSAAASFFNKKEAAQDSMYNDQNEQPFFKTETPIQTKLNIGKPNDRFEKEADAVADKITSEKHIDNPPPAPRITPLVQKQSEEEEMIQEKPAFESPTILEQAEQDFSPANDMPLQRREEEEESLQAKSEDTTESDTSQLEQSLSKSKGKGNPLPDPVKTNMESGFGRDFSNVRTHTDSNAVQMSKDLGAQAFTHGNDVYFNEGKYNPGTQDGDHLLAHELTHTVQQGGVQKKAIQKVENTNSPPATNTQGQAGTTTPPPEPPQIFTDTAKGVIDLRPSEKEITIPELQIPDFKTGFTPTTNLVLPKKTDEERPNTQASKWDEEVKKGTDYTDLLATKLQMDEAPAHTAGRGLPVYFLKLKRARNNYVIGTATDVKNRTTRPFWDVDGRRFFHDVDHKRELQLGGEDVLANYWLLESKANQSSGRNIKDEKNAKIRALLSESAKGNQAIWTTPPSLDDVRRTYKITFSKVVGGLDQSVGDHTKTYEMAHIKRGDQFDGLQNMTKEEVDAAGLRGDPATLKIFTSATGGGVRDVPWGEVDGTTKALSPSVSIGKNFKMESVTYTKGSGGTVRGPAFKRDRDTGIISTRTIDLEIKELAGIEYGGFISQASIDRALKTALTASFASPIELSEISLQDGEGFVGRGVIKPSLPFLSADTTIDVVIDGDGARLEKVFNIGEIAVPPPFVISNSELFVSFGTDGLKAGGRVNFGINRVGEGFVEGSIGTDGKLAVSGAFDFDSTLFDPARVEVSYIDEILSVTGTLGIPRNKVTGIKTATVTVNYSEGNLTANGNAELDIKGVESGTLNLAYSEDQFTIGGSFQLSNEIPGIRGGSVEVEVEKLGDEEGWKVKASGTAQPDIPGINSSLTVEYDDGALLVKGSASYERGLLSGMVEVGATNRAIGDDGQPTGPAGDTFSAFGGGELTLQLTPWLAATAGVHFLPNGEIEVKGRIGLPSSVDIFPRKSFDRNLFRMPTIEIPIFAIPLGPRSLGLVATINGGLDFTAGFGPGQLQELFGEVTYNPSQPENTALHGRGKFVIPADAGLTLKADLGLGLSVGIASLTGGIEIAGSLGLEGEAAAEVDVNWSPTEGFSLDALGSITVNPKFQFDVNLLARAKLDLWLFSISKEWRHNLASFQWGPDIQFGIKFPIHYQEGEPFDISFDDLEVIYPELDIGSLASGIAKDVKDDVF